VAVIDSRSELNAKLLEQDVTLLLLSVVEAAAAQTQELYQMNRRLLHSFAGPMGLLGSHGIEYNFDDFDFDAGQFAAESPLE
jgi:hypothetical protein